MVSQEEGRCDGGDSREGRRYTRISFFLDWIRETVQKDGAFDIEHSDCCNSEPLMSKRKNQPQVSFKGDKKESVNSKRSS